MSYFKTPLWRNSLRYLAMVFLFCAGMSVFAQNLPKNDVKLQQLKKEFELKNAEAKRRIDNTLSRKGTYRSKVIKKRFKDEEGRTWELIDIRKDGSPLYYVTSNAGAATTIKTTTLHPGGELGLNLTGSNYEIAIWDNGYVRSTHELYGGRTLKMDDATEEGDHATHVGGTMIGGGNVQNGAAKGMAYDARLLSFDWNNDVSEAVSTIQSRNILISNHSYGWGFDVFAPTTHFGKYTTTASDWDAVHEAAPYYLQVKAAGNPRWGFNFHKPEREGWDLLSDFSLSKNNIVVAAVEQVDAYTGPSSVRMSSFSAFGPTDDGRVKPDISAKGVATFSAVNTSDTSYIIWDGTSMAAPSVAGSLLLLQQYHKQLTGSYLKSSTLKGLALHTADEAGAYPGPDYKFGWGLMNTKNAALAIKNKGGASVIKENVLNNGSSYTLQVVANGTDPIVVTVCWTDPAGVPNNSEIEDERTLSLVNDLDLRVFDGNVENLPWILNPAKPNDPARRGDNKVDNVEKIELVPVYAGQIFTIRVNHKGTLKNGSQAYALIVTGAKEPQVSCSVPAWKSDVAYQGGTQVSHKGFIYKSRWWTLNNDPETNSGQWAVWEKLGPCGSSNQSPVVSIVAPTTSTVITGLTKFTIRINATDPDGTISKVFVKATDQGGTKYYPATKVGSEYVMDYTPRAYGTLILTAVAVDNLNTPAEVTLNQKVWEQQTTPTLTILSPSNGAYVNAGVENEIYISASGSVNRGMGVFVSGVDFTLAETRLSGEGPAYQYMFVPDLSLFNRSVTLRVQLKELSTGSVVHTRTVTLNVKKNILPTVEILSFKDSLFSVLNTVKIRARALDSDGTVNRVYLKYYDGVDFETMDMTNVGNNTWEGNYTPEGGPIMMELKVLAQDNAGETGEGRFIVRIAGNSENIPPVVNIYTPQNDTTYTGTINNRLRLVFDTYNGFNEGPEYIKETRVYADGVEKMHFVWEKKYGTGKDTSVKFDTYGAHTIRVETLDERGMIGFAQVNFTLQSEGPTISILSPMDEQPFYLDPSNPTAFIDVDVNDEDVNIDSVRYVIVDVYSRGANVRRFTVTAAPFDLTFVPALDAYRTEIYAIAFSNGRAADDYVYAHYYKDIMPSLSIVTPAEGQQFYQTPGNTTPIEVTVDVNNEEIQIDSVHYIIVDHFPRNGTAREYTVKYPPFSLIFDPIFSSRTEIKAFAWGNGYRKSVTVSRNIFIIPTNVPPTVSITYPAEGGQITDNKGYNFIVNASDSDGQVVEVAYTITGTGYSTVQTITQAPFTLYWGFSNTGNYQVKAAAKDDKGSVTESSIVNFTVVSGKPTVSIISPATGSTVVKNQPVNVQVSVGDIDGTVTQVQYRIFGVSPQPQLIYVTQAPFTLNYTFTATGNVTIDAASIDNDNRISEYAAINLTVIEGGCTLPQWDATVAYNGGAQVQYNGIRYKARWWTKNENPSTNSGPWAVWENLGPCTGTSKVAAVEALESIQLYPNPTEGAVSIESSFEGEYSVTIVNTLGEEVYSKANVNTAILSADLSSQPKGLYVVKLVSGDQVRTLQLVIE